ncbi:MAG: ferredoxin family protein [Deltaproteobacteria bacterium]|nr:MAG: ferredoxin family protein [Deltaproteobacteria bacterium]
MEAEVDNPERPPDKGSPGARKGAGGRVFINRERCKGCGYCVEFCPAKVLELDTEYNQKGYHPPVAARPDACTGCDLCGMFCPDFAIHGERVRKKVERSPDGAKGGEDGDDAHG